MRPVIVVTIAAASMLVLALPRPAAACSIVNDIADPPDNELGFDAAESPAAPFVVEARISHYHEDTSCQGGGTCGDIHGLSLSLQVDTTTELIRIDFADRDTIYAHVWNADSGQVQVFIPGYADDDRLDITLSAIDARGYRSEGTQGTVINPGHGDGGCSTSGRHSSAVLVLLAAAFAVHRRRRRT